ncbi:transposase [Streptomyces atratus]|uniref:transposase n=1 Tax=Streptomyces atratus TaxID=1893 RepID=UPI0033E57802
MLCADGPVRSLVEVSLVGEHRRGHGGLHDALPPGRVLSPGCDGLWRRCRCRGRRTAGFLAADLTCWLRPSAHTSPQRILCHTYGRGKDQHIPVPGWPYSVICALETGRSSWTAPLDALRLTPGDDAATVTAGQMRELVERLMAAGQWKDGDLEILIVVDAGYDVPRLAFLLKDLPVQVLGRMRSDRFLRRAVPARESGVRGRPPRHGGEFVFGDPATWGTPDEQTVTEARLYGAAVARVGAGRATCAQHGELPLGCWWGQGACSPDGRGLLFLQLGDGPIGSAQPVRLPLAHDAQPIQAIETFGHIFDSRSEWAALRSTGPGCHRSLPCSRSGPSVGRRRAVNGHRQRPTSTRRGRAWSRPSWRWPLVPRRVCNTG